MTDANGVQHARETFMQRVESGLRRGRERYEGDAFETVVSAYRIEARTLGYNPEVVDHLREQLHETDEADEVAA